MSTTRRRLEREQSPIGSSIKGGDNTQHNSIRCKTTHDVPYTLRCVLRYNHVWSDQPHEDKDGRTW